MRRQISIFLLSVAVATSNSYAAKADILTATPSSIAGAKFQPQPLDSSAPIGVSPEVYFEENSKTYYLYTTAEITKIYTSKDGSVWTEASNYRLPNGFDWSIVKMGENSYRLYYASIMPGVAGTVRCSQQKKALFYATSTDLLNWSPQPGPIVDDVGCGVPHVLKKKDGKYLLYYNTITTMHGMHVQSSDDGIKWSALPGIISNNQSLVDPAPIEMPDGTFLMVASTTGNPQKNELQELQILSSKDGIAWEHRSSSLYAPTGYSVLDPALKLIDGKLRVWHGYTQGNDHSKSRIANGNLTLIEASVGSSAKSKSVTVYCVKGKQKRMTESGKCPKGWKAKKIKS
jgi:hypothetical protein